MFACYLVEVGFKIDRIKNLYLLDCINISFGLDYGEIRLDLACIRIGYDFEYISIIFGMALN